MATAFAYRLKDSASSDSDTDNSDKECLNWKRVTKNENEESEEKVPLVPPPIEPSPAQSTNSSSLKRKRNTIWCDVLEDQMISETLNHCGIKNKPKGYGERGEESYDYTLGKEYKSDRSEDEMTSDSRNRNKRFRRDNSFDLNHEEKEAAKKIIKVLAERKTYLIYRIVKYLGVETAIKYLKMTEEIEDNGGLMTKNQDRRRTPGGVYLHLLRSDKSIDKEVMDKIFDGEFNSFEMKKKYDELRKLKNRKRGGKHRKKTKNRMECESSTTEVQDEPKNDLESAEMEEDIDNVVKDCPNIDVNERTSDLEEGEVE